MKNKITTLLILLSSFALGGCIDDDSTLSDNSIKEITISGIEKSYTATAYTGQRLTIQPDVDYDKDLDYLWYVINSKTGTTTASGDTIQPTIIGQEKNLDYEVNLAPGNYQLRLQATDKSTGIKSYKYASLEVSTAFSHGFYIMKQTADGNTDIDVLNEDGTLSQDLIAKTSGSAMTGKPLDLCILYNSCYIDEESNDMETMDGVSVTTDANNFAIYRNTDLKQIFDRSNLLYETMDANEKVFGFTYTMMTGHIIFTSSGPRNATGPDYSGNANSGKYGNPLNEIEGATFFCHDIPSYGGVFGWDSKTHSLFTMDYNGYSDQLLYRDLSGSDETQNLTDYDCIAAGYNLINSQGTAIFILNNQKTGERYLYQTKSGFAQMYLKSRTKIPSDFHLAKANTFSVNGMSAKYIYCVDNNKIYATVFSGDELAEVEVPTEIPAGEKITYVGNQYYYTDNFNYLVVGTQNGDHYKLYFFKLVGGAADGKAVLTAEGTGDVKSVKYMHNGFNSNYWMYGYPMYNQNN